MPSPPPATSVADPALLDALRGLAAAYAGAVDRRDAERLRAAFHPDAVLVVHGRDGLVAQPERRRHGRDEIGAIVEQIARYPTTFHLLGQSTYELDGERDGDGGSGGSVHGEVYCEAHHHDLAAPGGPVDRIMYIRYQDEYRPDATGRWLISARTVEVDWTTEVPLPAGPPAGPSAGPPGGPSAGPPAGPTADRS